MLRKLSASIIVALALVPLAASAITLDDVRAQVSQLLAQVQQLQARGHVLGVATSCPNLVRNLSRGARGSDVSELQQFLISQQLLAADMASGFYGAMTEAAVKQFQCKEMGVCTGAPSTNGYGAVGPMTRAKIAEVCRRAVATGPQATAESATPISDLGGGNAALAVFTALPQSGTPPLAVTFSAPAGDEDVLTIQFGDGSSGQMVVSSPNASMRTLAHTYSTVGTYTAILTKQAMCVGMGSCTPPKEVARTTIVASSATTYAWEVGAWGQCVSSTQTRSVVCKSSLGATVADSFCPQPKPATSQACTANQSCTFNGQTVAHGSAVTAYQNSSGTTQQCSVTEQRTCTNGTLSGSYQYGSCSAQVGLLPIPTVKSTVGIRGGFRNVYAPTVATVSTGESSSATRMWLCGWKTNADPDNYTAAVAAGQSLTSIVGPDKIWMSEFDGANWSDPVLSFQKVGFHVCDPSVVRPPSTDGVDRSRWAYLYYTGLDNRFAASPTDQVQNNVTGLASSVDGGATWNDLGIRLDRADGGDGFGAWAASALVVGDEIWLYYVTGNQNFSINNTFRQRMNANGWQKIGAPEPLTYAPGLQFNEGTSATLLSNLDVHKDGSKYVMLANTYDLKRIVRLVSDNGLAWRSETVDPVLTNSGANFVITPFWEPASGTDFNVYFGYGDTPPSLDSHGVHKWTFGW